MKTVELNWVDFVNHDVSHLSDIRKQIVKDLLCEPNRDWVFKMKFYYSINTLYHYLWDVPFEKMKGVQMDWNSNPQIIITIEE